MEPVLQILGQEPVVPLGILLLVILVVPILFERLKLPALVGLVFSGIVLGPSGWNLFRPDLPIINLLSNIGLVYFMFVAGLEQDFSQLHHNKQRSLGFASFTLTVSLVMGIFIGRILGFGWNNSLFISCLIASYTLLAYPIIQRLGVMNNQAVSAAIGATTITDLSSLLILAACVANSQFAVFNLTKFFTLLVQVGIYSTIIIVSFNLIGQEIFCLNKDNQSNKFLFVILALFLAVILAQWLGIEKIIGAFLAGLVANKVLGEGPVKEKVIFVGNILFIPIFFVSLGFLLDLSAGIKSVLAVELVLLLFIGVITSKFLATLLAKIFYRYDWQEMLTVWSICIPQVSTTLAAAFVGYRVGLLPKEVLHSVIILMLITATFGPLLTSRLAVALTFTPMLETVSTSINKQQPKAKNGKFTIVVPIDHPQTQQYLIEIAALLARQKKGKIIPLAIASATAYMDAPNLETSLQRSERLLAKATTQSFNLGVEALPLLRIDDGLSVGVSRAAREQKADLIVMGWAKLHGWRARLVGNPIDGVFWASHCPVVATRLVDSPHKIQRILVPLENLTLSAFQPLELAQMLAEVNQAQVTVLNVCDRHTSLGKIAARRSQLSVVISQLALQNPPEMQIITHENAAQAILQAARLYDLVVLPFVRNHTTPGGSVMSDIATRLARQLTCSIILVGEPQRTQIPIIERFPMPAPEVRNKTA